MIERRRVTIRGLVQGVYFRETVRRIAENYEVSGFVRNVGRDRVELQAEGLADILEAFVADILAHPPPAAVVEDVRAEIVVATGEIGFAVVRTLRE